MPDSHSGSRMANSSSDSCHRCKPSNYGITTIRPSLPDNPMTVATYTWLPQFRHRCPSCAHSVHPLPPRARSERIRSSPPVQALSIMSVVESPARSWRMRCVHGGPEADAIIESYIDRVTRGRWSVVASQFGWSNIGGTFAFVCGAAPSRLVVVLSTPDLTPCG